MLYSNELQRAFREKNKSKFKEILEVCEADPNSYPDRSNETNFEIVLRTPGSSNFIAQCIEYGADFNVKRAIYSEQTIKDYKYPIHYVIESACIENLETVKHLLDFKSNNTKNISQSTYVNVKDKNGKNCLHLLAEKLTNENFGEIFTMMKILMTYGCNANSLSNQGKTPFSILVDKLTSLENGSEILTYFKDKGNIDINVHEKMKLSASVLSSYFNPFKKDEIFFFYMTRRLLEKGAYIGPVITNIRKSLLNDFLDSCIISNSRFHDEKDFKLMVDYKFLYASLNNKKHESKQININIRNSKHENLHPPKHQDHQDNYPEMASLKKLVENTNLQRLIMHPVLASFVFLKWSKIRYLIHLNLVLTLLYIFSFIPFVLLNEHRATSNNYSTNIFYKQLYLAPFLSLTLLIIREMSQLILSPKTYFLSRSNWVDMVLILASFAILLDLWSRKHQLRMLHTIIILLAMWEYFNILGYLPLLSVSLHTKIFRKVFTTFFKSLAFYSVMIIGFALAFYTLQGNKFARDLKSSINDTQILNSSSDSFGEDFKNKSVNFTVGEIPSNQTRSDRYNNFYTVGHSIVKSFVMLTGELDASNIKLEGYTYSALFLLYLFIVTIVLYNLLNALAVSDTQEIKTDAKLIDLQQRVFTMHQSEEAIFHGFVGGRFKLIGDFLKKFISMFPQTVENCEISLCPNDNRFINADSSSKLKLNNDIINDMCTLLLKKQEERAAERKRKLKERTYEKLSCDIIKMKEDIRVIQNCLKKFSHKN